MRRPHLMLAVLAALAAAVLVHAGPAVAKQVVGVSVCGAEGCVDRTGALGDQREDGGLLDVGTVVIGDPAPAPFVRIRLRIGDPRSGQTFGTSTLVVVPARRAALADDGVWRRLPRRAMTQVRRIVDGVAGLPFSRLRRPVAPADATPSDARVAEVVAPPAPQPHADGDGVPAATIGAAGAVVAVIAVAGAAGVIVRRRRRHGPQGTPATG